VLAHTTARVDARAPCLLRRFFFGGIPATFRDRVLSSPSYLERV
jgi:hypothetical protein